MSIFIKKNKNPYDNFKINSSKLIQRTLSTKKELRLNSSFKCTNQRLLLSGILKGTESILNNKNKFSGYMNEYHSIVAKLTFKRPDRIHQPKGSIKFNPKAFGFKKSTSKVLNKLAINNVNDKFKNNPEIQDSNNVINNEDKNSLYKTNNKIITIHANPELRKK